ncbi:MAG: flippase [Coriobacteriia bacterium]|nr:flippase [Coriobacteriia bacterium]
MVAADSAPDTAASQDPAAPPPRRSIVANTAVNGVAQFASLVSTLVFFPLLVKAFGIEQYGVYVIAMTVTGIAVMFDLGVGASTVRLVARRVSLDDADGFARVVVTSVAVMLALGVVVAGVIAAIALAAGSLFNVSAEQAELLRTLLLIGAALQLWTWPASVAAQVLQGLERYDLVARTSLISTLATLAAIGTVLVLHRGPVVLMLLGVTISLVASVINMFALAAVRPAGRMAVMPQRSVAEEIVSGGIPIFAVSFTQFVNREQTDRLVVAIMLGPLAVALYEVAAKLSMLVSQVIGLPISAVLPVASRMAAAHDDEGLRDLFVRGSRNVVLAVLPIICVLVVLAGPFIRLWFGPGFESSIMLARLLVVAQVFVPLYLIGDLVLMGKGRIALWVPPGLALALLNVILSVMLVPRFGLVGVSFGTVLAGFLELPVYAWLILPELGVGFSRWIGVSAAGYLLAPVAVGVAALGTLTPLAGSMLGVGVIAVVAVGAYWACAYALLLSPRDRLQLRARIAVPLEMLRGGSR